MWAIRPRRRGVAVPKLVDRPPANIPVEPAKGRIGCGVLLLAVAIGLAFAHVAQRQDTEWPRTALPSRSIGESVLVYALRGVLWIPIAILAITGLRLLLEGLTRRNYKEASCRRCGGVVVAKKRHFGLLCPNDNYGHYAKIYWSELVSAVVVLGLAALLLPLALRQFGVL